MVTWSKFESLKTWKGNKRWRHSKDWGTVTEMLTCETNELMNEDRTQVEDRTESDFVEHHAVNLYNK